MLREFSILNQIFFDRMGICEVATVGISMVHGHVVYVMQHIISSFLATRSMCHWILRGMGVCKAYVIWKNVALVHLSTPRQCLTIDEVSAKEVEKWTKVKQNFPGESCFMVSPSKASIVKRVFLMPAESLLPSPCHLFIVLCSPLF